jgi:hypothetical protein
VNVVLLASASDATLMLNFCEVSIQNLTGEALVDSAEANFLSWRFWFFLRRRCQKERREFSQCDQYVRALLLDFYLVLCYN